MPAISIPAGSDRLFAFRHAPCRFPAASRPLVTCPPAGGSAPGEAAPPHFAALQMPRSGSCRPAPARGGPHQAELSP